MSTCQRCQQPIVWVPKPPSPGNREPGYFRPLEVVEIEGAGVLYVVNGPNLLQVTGALLQWHVCAEDRPPMPRVVTDDIEFAGELSDGPERPLTDAEERELELARRDQERDAAIQAKIDADLAKYDKARREKWHDPHSRIPCPRCGVAAGEPCRSLGSPARERPTNRAHEWRRAAYDGGTNADEGTLERPHPQAMGGWAGDDDITAITWPFCTLDQRRELRGWLYDHADLLTNLGETNAAAAD